MQAFHEASADFIALISALHFRTVSAEVLRATGGNLDGFNRLSRFAEISRTQQVRLASNDLTMQDFQAGWDSEHELSKPLLGALFDTLVDTYHERLVERDLIPRRLEELADAAVDRPDLLHEVQREFESYFLETPDEFERALIESRDVVAIILKRIWGVIGSVPGVFEFLGNRIQELAVSVDELPDFAVAQAHFRARSVGQVRIGPRTRAPEADSHGFSSRFLSPATYPNRGRSVPRPPSMRGRSRLPETGL